MSIDDSRVVHLDYMNGSTSITLDINRDAGSTLIEASFRVYLMLVKEVCEKKEPHKPRIEMLQE